MRERNWYVLNVNPRPWAVGPLSAGRNAAGKVYAKMGRNQELHNYEAALAATLLEEYPYLREYVDASVLKKFPDLRRYVTGDVSLNKGRSLFAGADVEMEFHFWRKLETAEVDGKSITDKVVDLTNMVKASEDAMAGLLFNNDSQVRKQTNIIHQQDSDVIEGLVVICIQLFGPAAYEDLPPHVWERIDEIIRASNGEDGAESSGFTLF